MDEKQSPHVLAGTYGRVWLQPISCKGQILTCSFLFTEKKKIGGEKHVLSGLDERLSLCSCWDGKQIGCGTARRLCCCDRERVPLQHRGDRLAIERWPGGSGHCPLLPALMLFLRSGRVCRQAAQENVTGTRGTEQSAGFTVSGLATSRRKFCLCSTKGFIKGHGNIWVVAENL